MDIDPKKLFFPNKAIRQENKQFFAGRRDLLRDACLSVGRDDFSALVYGDRGVGKTSFGWQLLELLSGNLTLAESGDLNLPANLSQCKCIWLQCRKDMQNIQGVLLSLIQAPAEKYAFSQEFSEIHDKGDLRNAVEKKLGINFGVLTGEVTIKPANEQPKTVQNVQDIFINLIRACKQADPNQSIIIFLDEFDSLPDRSGVGQLIKATDDARFVIIGIADNVDEIIEDHLSAARKLAGSKFRIPGFNTEEINFVFDKAEEVTNRKIIFDREFREQVIFRAYGYPFLVQQFGFFATQLILDSGQAVNYPLRIGVADLQSAIDRLFKDSEENRLYKSLFEVLQGDGQAKKEILRVVAESVDDILVENIRYNNKISVPFKRYVEENIKDLIEESKVLKRVEDNRVRFRDPEARILTQVYFDSEQKS